MNAAPFTPEQEARIRAIVRGAAERLWVVAQQRQRRAIP